MFPKVSEQRIIYSVEPDDSDEYTSQLDRQYSRYARAYDIGVKRLPVWKTWIKSVIPLIEGTKVLEVSFGTGYLLTQYAGQFDTNGIDFNPDMVITAQQNLRTCGIDAKLQQANAESLPYQDCIFDTIINTMAFSGYPNGQKVMSEFYRVLKPGGLLLIVDFEYPENRNIFGFALTKLMERGGDTIRELSALLRQSDFDFSEKEIGGFGSVHQYVARKN